MESYFISKIYNIFYKSTIRFFQGKTFYQFAKVTWCTFKYNKRIYYYYLLFLCFWLSNDVLAQLIDRSTKRYISQHLVQLNQFCPCNLYQNLFFVERELANVLISTYSTPLLRERNNEKWWRDWANECVCVCWWTLVAVRDIPDEITEITGTDCLL